MRLDNQVTFVEAGVDTYGVAPLILPKRSSTSAAVSFSTPKLSNCWSRESTSFHFSKQISTARSSNNESIKALLSGDSWANTGTVKDNTNNIVAIKVLIILFIKL